MRTATPCSVQKVNATVDALAGEYGWICFGSEMVCVRKLVLEDCGMVVWSGVLGREVEGGAGIKIMCLWLWGKRRMRVAAV